MDFPAIFPPADVCARQKKTWKSPIITNSSSTQDARFYFCLLCRALVMPHHTPFIWLFVSTLVSNAREIHQWKTHTSGKSASIFNDFKNTQQPKFFSKSARSTRSTIIAAFLFSMWCDSQLSNTFTCGPSRCWENFDFCKEEKSLKLWEGI